MSFINVQGRCDRDGELDENFAGPAPRAYRKTVDDPGRPERHAADRILFHGALIDQDWHGPLDDAPACASDYDRNENGGERIGARVPDSDERDAGEDGDG